MNNGVVNTDKQSKRFEVVMLKEELETYEDPEDVEYWIKGVREDME